MSAAVVLIADDDETDVLFLRQALSESCPAVKLFDVSDGEQAIDYLAGRGKFHDRARFPLPTHIFLDVKMPRRSGLEVLGWLRARREFAEIPVTILSGSQLEGDREKALALGAEYAVKPIGYDALLDVAKQFCARAGLLRTE